MLSNRLANTFRTAMFCLLATVSLPQTSHATTVRMKTVLGPIDIVLYDQEVPSQVANFLALVNSGAYDNSAFASGLAFWAGWPRGTSQSVTWFQLRSARAHQVLDA